MIKTAIVPLAPSYISAPNSLNVDYKAICCFAAIGFFLDDDTYFLNRKVRKPAHIYEDDKDLTGTPYFKWHYAPRNISFSQAVDEFADLFDTITKEQVAGKRVILPLSGGLDSRSQAAALKGFPNIQTYSYKFAHGFNETQYAEKIAQRMGWNFKAFTIPEGYLWRKIDELSKINHCYAEFTHPRQMAIVDEFPAMGDLFYIGHWGDVLFDDMGVKDDLPFDQQVDVLMKKIVKKGGLELGTALWQTWNLPGNFEVYLKERITTLLSAINIDNANARLRAFKSLYWVPRWTSVNLSVFQKYHPVALPYYDNRMCEFICTIPEKFLSGRQIQIEYIKRKAPELAEIPWQALHPCNLYNYKQYSSFKNQSVVFAEKVWRKFEELINGKPYTERNWEIQFLGKDNDAQLRSRLFTNPAFAEFIPQAIVRQFYTKFLQGMHVQKVWYAHPISMLLTLAQFVKNDPYEI